MSTGVNDVHSRLNATTVDDVAAVRSLEEIVRTLRMSRAAGRAVSIAGGRHSMGGQQFCSGGTLLDTRRLDRVLSLDLARATIEVEAGMQWPALAAALADSPLTFAQKQTGANDLCLGGAVSANVHGRGLTMQPFVGEIERLVVVGADGVPRQCSRTENTALFRHVCGGYGLFGVVYSVVLRLVPRRMLERVVELRSADELADAFAERIDDGYLYGDFQFAVDGTSPDFLRRGVFSCYRPVEDQPEPAGQCALSLDDWRTLLRLAHTDKTTAFELYAAHYLSTSGQLYASDRHQLAQYIDGYHDHVGPGSEVIAELSVPRGLLADFLAAAARELRRLEANVIYGTVRLIERDDETALAWAREPWACTVLNLHVDHDRAGLERAAAAFLRLNDLALERGGTFYLTYHRWATRRQLLGAYPQLPAFLAAKAEHDPTNLFQSDWYRWLRRTTALEAAA
jgi:FAD/FMN-containing dehydrogenase